MADKEIEIMTEREMKGPANWWEGLKSKASQAFFNQQAGFARGRIAGVTVVDDAGRTLIEAGQRIDDDVIAKAKKAGKIAALAASAMKAQTQDLKEKVGAHYSRTEAGQEALLLGSVEEYREARRYVGRTLTMDVTDIRGNVVASSGKELDEEDIRRVRDAGLLAAFLVAAQDSLPPASHNTVAPPPLFPTSAPRRAPVLLAEPEEEEEV